MKGIKFLLNKIIQLSCLIALMATSITGYAQDDGFNVIVVPVPTDEIVIKEVCNGTAIGTVFFTLNDNGGGVSSGEVYSTTTDHLIEITGTTRTHPNFSYVSTPDDSPSFRASPNSLPPPTRHGVKGPYYFSHNGLVIYARFL